MERKYNGMTEELNQKLQEYARLLVRIGLNIQDKQTLVISAPVECAYFARMCAKEAYEANCREVVMSWSDDTLTRLKYLHGDEAIFDEVPLWNRHFFTDYAYEGAAYLAIHAEDPENLKGVDPKRLKRAQVSGGKAKSEFRRLEMTNGFPWCVASVPIPAWAKVVFPNDSEDVAMDKLWEGIFKSVRINGDGKSVERWREHLDTMAKRQAKLNELNFKSVHYSNSLGTDLTVELPEGHLWVAGGDTTPKGQVFIANMPTEEIFSAPQRDGVNGVVYSAMPLVMGGNIIDKFHLVLKDGKIVEVHAEKGEQNLKDAISVDENAAYLGEIALVPYDSPISNQKILFYNTLFDENAACHFAFGAAYPCLKGGDKMTSEELKAHGLNDSITHVDFMVGTKDLKITGTTHDGKEVPVFVDGNFVI